ncbi:dTMP kinase [Vibrio rumoiensis]|uniref:Thymidylate kinase n=1 Tax=Vibrio rumoiensis 1S-45 TaxID=1188252 RepID=A0A1E5E3K3_9VIBR|nr:dTMP kinase [Vibrio rumoiensis]OEF26926.1 dTMP kinase [Vibrio rumoiensis 1S-45]
MNNAKFIVIEGLEGAGKSTAINCVLNVLHQHRVGEVIQTREPGGTVLAEKLRSLVKEEHEGEVLQDISELLIMYAARVQLVENKIKPALAQNTWVLGDRHDLSSQAYQGGGRQLSQDIMSNLKQTALGDFKPDLTLYLDIDPEIGLQRARGRGELDRIEKMDLSFFERVRARYTELAQLDKTIITINANQTIEQVAHDIEVALNQWFSNGQTI